MLRKMTNAERIRSLRSTIAYERHLVDIIRRMTDDSNLKWWLRFASRTHDELEQWLLGTALDATLTPDDLSKWLDGCENTLRLAIEQRKSVAHCLPDSRETLD